MHTVQVQLNAGCSKPIGNKHPVSIKSSPCLNARSYVDAGKDITPGFLFEEIRYYNLGQ